MATVILCSDEPALAHRLTSLFSGTGEFELVSCRPNAADLRSQIELHRPDLLLVDLTGDFTPGLFGGLQNVARQTRTILRVRYVSMELALRAMSFGVRGILRETVSDDTLLRCLARVREGELWFDKGLTDSIMSSADDARHQEQLVRIAERCFLENSGNLKAAGSPVSVPSKA